MPTIIDKNSCKEKRCSNVFRVTESPPFVPHHRPRPSFLTFFLCNSSFQCTCNTPFSHDSGCLHCAESPPFVPHHRPRPSFLTLFLCNSLFQCTCNTPLSHDSGCLHCAESPRATSPQKVFSEWTRNWESVRNIFFPALH